MKTYRKNKRILSELIQEMKSFTLEQLIQRFHQTIARGSRLIDGRQTIKEFLEELRERRFLRRHRDHWSVKS